MTGTLDKIDISILKALQENARITNKELAAKVHLSPSPVYERLKRLESEGYIERYTAVLNAEKLNLGFIVFCSVKLQRLNTDIAGDFVAKIREIPEVTECYNVSGEYDYLLKIRARNMKQYNDFIINTLGTLDTIGSIQSSFVMNEIKHSYGLCL